MKLQHGAWRVLGSIGERCCLAAPLLGLVPLAGCGDDGPAAVAPESVILISIDTLRRDHVGLYGYERDTTPNLDALAKESLVFDQCYTTMSFTLIAHMSLLTGLYPRQHKVFNRNKALAESFPTLQQRLKEQGYHNMGFYYPGWLDPRYGFDRGFDVYAPHRNAEQAELHMRKAMAARPTDRPFFLFVHLFDVHNAPLIRGNTTIYDPPAPFDEHFLADARAQLGSFPAGRLWDQGVRNVTPERHEAIVALYDGGIRYVDHKIGSWIEAWREEGILDESILLITSDHGEGLRQRMYRYGGHGGTNQEGLHVPLLMCLPGGHLGGRRIDRLTSHVDLVPTVLDLLRLDPDPRLAGVHLLGGRDEDSMVYAQNDKLEVAIRWPYKLLDPPGENILLFDLARDPLELDPFMPRMARWRQGARIDDLQDAIAADQATWFYPEGPGTQAGEMSAEDRALLLDLGYAGED